MNITLDYYHTYGPTGKIYATCLGTGTHCNIEYRLLRDGITLEKKAPVIMSWWPSIIPRRPSIKYAPTFFRIKAAERLYIPRTSDLSPLIKSPRQK
ncbi:hypothetical protein ABK905_11240 [Acerihabitans sp. KWT182]|uniref:Uncharacterized protein n=1 Tax=Acerihabitans sp. KWT182 TaxID=3157919 RepID=A0AAU7QEG0_9GAMM